MKSCHLLTAIIAVSTITLSSCRHKDLYSELDDRGDIYVVFDWRNAPEANPTSMLVYFYSEDKNSTLLYTFADAAGGHISIPYDHYHGIAINGDNSDWGGLRNTDDSESFEIYTHDAESLQGYGIQSRSVPRAEGTENERMARTPGMIWGDRRDNIILDATSTAAGANKYITFYPEEGVCHYTVDVIDIENMDYLHGAEVDATISGMAEGYQQGKRSATDVSVTMPFVLSSDAATSSLHSQFLTFGECSKTAHRHILTVYVYLTDGTKWYHSFDVTDQVSNAPDPRNVNIVVRGLNLPKPIAGGSGFIPDVNDWNDINIDLKM